MNLEQALCRQLSRKTPLGRTRRSWEAMKRRCLNPNADSYRLYGGRGISVCERWLKFKEFLADMGIQPTGMTLGRKNGNRDYEPENCEWQSRKEQANNRRTNRIIRFRGESLTLAQWSERVRVPLQTLWARLFVLGFPIEKAFTYPYRYRTRTR